MPAVLRLSAVADIVSSASAQIASRPKTS
jgi:hypothetical protein